MLWLIYSGWTPTTANLERAPTEERRRACPPTTHARDTLLRANTADGLPISIMKTNVLTGILQTEIDAFRILRILRILRTNFHSKLLEIFEMLQKSKWSLGHKIEKLLKPNIAWKLLEIAETQCWNCWNWYFQYNSGQLRRSLAGVLADIDVLKVLIETPQ